MKLKLWSLFSRCFLFSVQYGKKFPDIKLKLCTLYLVVVIFCPILEKNSLTWNWNYDPFISLLLFSAQYGKKIPWHGPETMIPLSRCCYFLSNMEKNSLTWTWNYVPFISLLLFSVQYGKKFPDMELKLCSLYLAVVIFRTMWRRICILSEEEEEGQTQYIMAPSCAPPPPPHPPHLGGLSNDICSRKPGCSPLERES